jgi:hypothetical protein
MPTWKPASAVFLGGTQQIKALIGARVRNRVHLGSVPLFDPIHHKQATTELIAGTVGFVANPNGANLLLAFASAPGQIPASLAQLQRTGNFRVVVVNEPTFKLQFEVEHA